MHKIHDFGLLRPDLLAFEQHLQRIAGGHQACHALAAPCAGKQPDLDFRQTDAGRVAVCHHAVMAGQRQFKRPAQTQTMDRHGKGLAAGLQLAVNLRQSPHAVEKLLHRRCLTQGLARLGIGLRHILQHGEVSPAGKGLLAGGDDAALYGRFTGYIGNHGLNLVHHLRGDDIHGAARHIPCQQGNAIRIGFKGEMGQIHNHLPQTRSIMAAVPMPAPMHNVISAVD